MRNEYLLVDGYNIIFSWEDLRALSIDNLESARIKLADILCNYQGFRQNEIILVFDGYKTKSNVRTIEHYFNIDIVYTKEAETADQYIEAVTQRLARNYNIRVATSDALEQIIILGKGASRVSARELKIEIEEANKCIKETYLQRKEVKRNSLMDNIPADMREILEKMRLDDK